MKKAEPITTTHAPKAIGPYSQGIVAGQFLLENVSAIVKSAGGSMADIVKVTLFLTDMADFQQVNEVYSRHFQVPYPARSAVQVSALPLGSNIEAEAIAYLP